MVCYCFLLSDQREQCQEVGVIKEEFQLLCLVDGWDFDQIPNASRKLNSALPFSCFRRWVAAEKLLLHGVARG